jgi:hypothetical protein
LRPEILDLIQNARKRKVEKFRTQLFTFAVCLFFAILFWFSVRLSREYYYTLDYRLNYTHIPENYRLTGYSDSTLTLKMRVQGFEFLSERYFTNQVKVIDISLKGIRMIPEGQHLSSYILTQKISKDIVFQANMMHDVYAISPDTLYFDFERVPLKKIGLSGEAGDSIRKHIQLYDTLVFEHDSIMKKRLKLELERIAKDKQNKGKE